VGIVGVAPNARLMALRACWQTNEASSTAPTVCNSLSLAKALHYAIDHGAKVINLSLSGPPDRLLTQLIEIAASRDISVVAAYDPSLPKGGFPASEPEVIAVANDSLPSAPPGVYLAPGNDVPTTQPGGKWFLVNGSSYAAAHISGLIALVREHRDTAPRPVLVAALPTGGAVDACATLQHAAKPCSCICPKPTSITQAQR
jgi:subtilisin family serine protease